MLSLSESSVEENLIELLKKQGYGYLYGPEIAPYSSNPMRKGFDSVILEGVFEDVLKRLNPNVPESAISEASSKVRKLGSSDLMANNEAFHGMLTDGVSVECFHNGQPKGFSLRIADFSNPENNVFHAVNQLVVKENDSEKRLDVVVFVNGLPLAVVELKNPMDENATLERAFTQIQNYKKAVPSVFHYNAVCVISDGLDARISSVSAPFSRYLVWKSPEKKENGILPELQILAERMFEKKTFLELVRYNTVFETEEVKDART